MWLLGIFSKLKAHCHGSDWINKTIKQKIIRQDSVISLYSEIHENDNDLIPFILETKDDLRTKRLGNYSKARALLLMSTSQLANHNYDSVPLSGVGTHLDFVSFLEHLFRRSKSDRP